MFWILKNAINNVIFYIVTRIMNNINVRHCWNSVRNKDSAKIKMGVKSLKFSKTQNLWYSIKKFSIPSITENSNTKVNIINMIVFLLLFIFIVI